jgi:hypothetical protein
MWKSAYAAGGKLKKHQISSITHIYIVHHVAGWSHGKDHI